jgi:hypothetical protein
MRSSDFTPPYEVVMSRQPEGEELQQILAAMRKYGPVPIKVRMNLMSLMAVLTACQIATTHPSVDENSAFLRVVERFIREGISEVEEHSQLLADLLLDDQCPGHGLGPGAFN